MTPHSNERTIAGIERCFGKAIQGPLEMLEYHHPPPYTPISRMLQIRYTFVTLTPATNADFSRVATLLL